VTSYNVFILILFINILAGILFLGLEIENTRYSYLGVYIWGILGWYMAFISVISLSKKDTPKEGL
jgi:hypothetical protein